MLKNYSKLLGAIVFGISLASASVPDDGRIEKTNKSAMVRVDFAKTESIDNGTNNQGYNVTQTTNGAIATKPSQHVTISINPSAPEPHRVFGGVYISDTIEIVSGSYGGTGYLSRPGYADPVVLMRNLSGRCSETAKCRFLVDNTLNDGKDPCWPTKKLLTVTYKCVNKFPGSFPRKETISVEEGLYAEFDCMTGTK